MKVSLLTLRLLIALGFAAAQGAAGLELNSGSAGLRLQVKIEPRFSGAPLVFDAVTNRTAAGQEISITRLDFLVSDFALRAADGRWIQFTNVFGFLSGRQNRDRFSIDGVPVDRYDKVRFHIGVPPAVNHSDAAQYPAGHPLNPDVNGLHWGWMGGYVFLALEGRWARAGTPNVSDASGYSYHLATDRTLMTVELPAMIDVKANAKLDLAFDVGHLFNSESPLVLDDRSLSTHSRSNDVLALTLARRVEQAFELIRFEGGELPVGPMQFPSPLPLCQRERGVSATALEKFIGLTSDLSFPSPLGREVGVRGISFAVPTGNGQVESSSRHSLEPDIYNPKATPYRFTFSSLFPRPALPNDNPLTEEGVALGRRLFFDPRLSINNSQSCASCHQAKAGFAEHKAVSTGAEGKPGTRNAMALMNLAWKSSFFWDGRAATLRQQVLQPIQNPIEMHENLSNVVEKLKSADAPTGGPVAQTAKSAVSRAVSLPYSTLFARAFGTPEITTDRIARALEQFLLVQTAYDSKFDRVMAGEEKFTFEEQRGFELFHTEYDPRREQYGADCFHCHGGPLFQSQMFANNGLDSDFKDPGRATVTGREGDRGKFAVPSLRNVELTAPYMHDGRFATLEEAVDHYCTGMKRSATLDPNLAKHPDGGMPLSVADKQALVAFLKTLTDTKELPIEN